MKTLIIYDLDGKVISQMSDGYRVPNGVPYIEAEVPNKKYVISVNVETKEAIFGDVHPTEIELLENKISILEQQNTDLENALVELASIVGGA